ncbi:MAG: DMT family transporter [Gammaproteobacteria bacterium]|nr:DMT family transporter [Gammaproteobacteria bacterium]
MQNSLNHCKAYFSLFVVALIWGSTFVPTQLALDDVSPLGFLALRFTIGAAILSIIYGKELKKIDYPTLLGGVVIGITLSAGFVLQTIGLLHTTTGKVGFITGVSVVFVPIFAITLFREKVTSKQIVSIALSVIGLALLSLNNQRTINTGDLWVFGCAVAFALQITFTGYYSKRHSPICLTVIQVATVAVSCFVASVIFSNHSIIFSKLTLSTWATLLYTGVGATGFAFLVQMRAQKTAPSVHVALILGLEAVFAILFGSLLLNETMTKQEIAGCILMLVGTVVIQIEGMNSKTSDQRILNAKNSALTHK